ncbi:oxidative stress survival, Svf1-like protein [Syncephalis plumigaleata]|nr:oxidative stress survival, Svf1-like protein [Syncephalis plumigaleata]
MLVKAFDNIDSPTELAGRLTTKDLQWTAISSACSESQTIYAMTEDNALFFIQLAYANAGFGTNIQVSYRYFQPASNTNIFGTHTCSNSDYKLSDDRLSVDCRPVSIHLNEAADTYKVSFHQDKEQIDFTITVQDRGFTLGKGRTYYGKGENAPYMAHRWWPRCMVKGVAILDGQMRTLDGRGTFIHAFAGMKPHTAASSTNLVLFHSSRVTLSLMEFTPPRHFNEENLLQGAIVLDGALLAVTVKNKLELLDEEVDDRSGYAVPRRIRIHWSGHTIEETSRKVDVTTEASLTVLAGCIDILEQLPWLVRRLIQALVAKPYVYEWLQETKTQLRIDDELIEETGHLLLNGRILITKYNHLY